MAGASWFLLPSLEAVLEGNLLIAVWLAAALETLRGRSPWPPFQRLLLGTPPRTEGADPGARDGGPLAHPAWRASSGPGSARGRAHSGSGDGGKGSWGLRRSPCLFQGMLLEGPPGPEGPAVSVPFYFPRLVGGAQGWRETP